MKKNMPLYILLIFLVVVNGFFLFNYLGRPNQNHEGPKGKQDNFIVKELKFDDTQKQKFEELKAAHFKRIEDIFEEERKLKDDLFDKISNDNIDASQIDSITSQIGEIAKAKDQETFYHFRAVQNICNDTQKEKFKQIIKQALHGKGKNGQGPPPPDRKRDGDRPTPKH